MNLDIFGFLGLVVFPAGLILFMLYEIIMYIVKSYKEKHNPNKSTFTSEQVKRMNSIIQEMCDARNQMSIESFKVLQSGHVTKEYEDAVKKCHDMLFSYPKTLDWMEIPGNDKNTRNKLGD